MNYQAERDRVELRIVERKLMQMTKDRDNFKDNFMTTFKQLSQYENQINDMRGEYNQLLAKFNDLMEKNNQIQMQQEDYRSRLMNNFGKIKEVIEKDKDLKQLEKELRQIKKRDNPYEYVDFNDVSTQTHNPVKEKG